MSLYLFLEEAKYIIYVIIGGIFFSETTAGVLFSLISLQSLFLNKLAIIDNSVIFFSCAI